MTNRDDVLVLLGALAKPLQAEFAFDETEAEHGLPLIHPLHFEVKEALSGRPAHFPHIGPSEVTWVTIGPSAQTLREAKAELDSWIFPSLAWEASPHVVAPDEGTGTLAQKLRRASPAGYLRWVCDRHNFKLVVERLAMMRQLAEQAPKRATRLKPTLGMLRRQFTLGLATGDHELASSAIEEIDRRQLDTAVNTSSMRIRRDDAFGDHQAIISRPDLDRLLTFKLPRQVRTAILRAHYVVNLEQLEETSAYVDARQYYRDHFHDRLVGLATVEEAASDPALQRMVGYGAWVDRDWQTLKSLVATSPVDPVLQALFQEIEPEQTVQSETRIVSAEPPQQVAATVKLSEDTHVESGPPSAAQELSLDLSWAELPTAIRTGHYVQVEVFLQSISTQPERLGQEIGDGSVLEELFTDDSIANNATASAHADMVLTSVIDNFVCEPAFPQKVRIPLYDTILEVWVASRAGSNDPCDGQLLLLITNAMLQLSNKSEAGVAKRIQHWWEARPARARLTWLAEALEMLTDQSLSEDYLTLWYHAAGIIRADPSYLKPSDLRVWVRLGRRLGLEAFTAREALGVEEDVEAPSAGDSLARAGLKKIAIVSLQERAAREAAQEIEQRSGAKVIIVTDYAAGEGTQSASTADVILFVWGAAKHAVYRAFDQVRDRLEYVQGTGSGSIIRALERWVERAQMD